LVIMAQTRKCINQNCDHKFSIDTRRVLFLPLTPAFGPFNPLLSIAMNDLSGPKALNWTRRRKTWDYLAAYFCLLFFFFSHLGLKHFFIPTCEDCCCCCCRNCGNCCCSCAHSWPEKVLLLLLLALHKWQ